MIHNHFVHSISNSSVDHFDIESINALIFCTVWWRNCTLFDIKYHTMLNTSLFCHQTTDKKIIIIIISALIDSISMWLTVELKIDWTKWVWINISQKIQSAKCNMHWIQCPPYSFIDIVTGIKSAQELWCSASQGDTFWQFTFQDIDENGEKTRESNTMYKFWHFCVFIWLYNECWKGGHTLVVWSKWKTILLLYIIYLVFINNFNFRKLFKKITFWPLNL